jgi:hypothetical protein
VSVEATLLTVGILLGVGWRASALRACGDTVMGVINLTLTGARHLIALGDAATVTGIT